MKDDLFVNMVLNLSLALKSPFFGCETMCMDKCRMGMATHEGHTINYVGHRLAHIESVIFKGVGFRYA